MRQAEQNYFAHLLHPTFTRGQLKKGRKVVFFAPFLFILGNKNNIYPAKKSTAC